MNFFMIFLLVTCGNLLADDWGDYWSRATEAWNNDDFLAAEDNFNLAIAEIERTGDQDHAYVYVDRARLYLFLNRNIEALSDLDKVLSNDKIQGEDRARAVLSRMAARSKIGGMDKGVLEDLRTFGEIKADQPVLEETESKIIIRNVPNCGCYRNIMSSYFVHCGICISKNVVKFLSSGDCIVNKTSDHNCRKCNEELENIMANTEAEQSCKVWCDRCSVAGAAWCTKVFKSYRCQAACAVALLELQRGCYWCCEGGSFYKKCIKPFEDILAYMGNGCDPARD